MPHLPYMDDTHVGETLARGRVVLAGRANYQGGEGPLPPLCTPHGNQTTAKQPKGGLDGLAGRANYQGGEGRRELLE